MMILFLLYLAAGYWAVNKTIYANKIVFYSRWTDLFGRKIILAFLLGWILIPIAIFKRS